MDLSVNPEIAKKNVEDPASPVIEIRVIQGVFPVTWAVQGP